jgi:lysozyme family protein
MASFDVAYRFMLANEDKTPPVYANVPDVGGSAIAGVNSKDWPVQFQKIANAPQDQRGPLVEQFYQMHFWSDWFDDLTSDEVAKRVFDASVNMGSVAAVRCLQQAVNVTYATESDDLLIPDGQWGLHTVTTTNLLIAMHGEASMVEAFQQSRVARYKAIAAANPALAHYLPQWIARAEK